MVMSGATGLFMCYITKMTVGNTECESQKLIFDTDGCHINVVYTSYSELSHAVGA